MTHVDDVAIARRILKWDNAFIRAVAESNFMCHYRMPPMRKQRQKPHRAHTISQQPRKGHSPGTKRGHTTRCPIMISLTPRSACSYVYLAVFCVKWRGVNVFHLGFHIGFHREIIEVVDVTADSYSCTLINDRGIAPRLVFELSLSWSCCPIIRFEFGWSC